MNDLESKWKGLRTTSIITFIEDPKYFKNILDGVVDEETPKFFETGTQVHMYLLEPNEFKSHYTFMDYTKPRGENQNKFCEYIAKNIKNTENIKELSVESYKKAYKTAKNKSDEKINEEAVKLYDQLNDYIKFLTLGSDKQVLNFSTLRYLKGVKEAVKKHKLASELIFSNELSTEDHYEEQRILWEFPLAKIHGENLVVKSTIDKMIIDHDNKIIKLVDLKTTNNLSEFSNRFRDHNNYKIQLACYWTAVETFFENKFPEKDISEYKHETYLIGVQTPNPYRDYPVNCRVWPISQKSLSEGLNIIEETLPDIAWHFENDLWDHKRIYYEGDGSEEML